ncbi:16S rRNA processing protein RimM [Desulfocapsa sulfexigens DSM 10523]|uniref:Ribosome maturation factor RimM n=1 Tax=Desulfocapsa sulfexigens (strain DSM 10523 / SB164P1) TaxID=1167006 RepID=M1PE63_DESSD|nr:ribosome maturation factor RimM [Desulfocapsa sulfexigens]AGF79872.1 16S rRNA processing protein RimM [Desulfocapsa sulfexigens DSM 10523]
MADSFPFEKEKYVLIGKVTKAHGIKGELKMHAYSGELQSVTRHKKLILVSRDGLITPMQVVQARIGNRDAIVSLEGVSDRNQSEALCGMGVLVCKEDLPTPDADEFYLHELEGLEVRTTEGSIVGTVEAFSNNGAQDLLVVKSGRNEVLIPLIPGMITEKNKKYLIIAPPPGLIEINSGEDIKGAVPRDL